MDKIRNIESIINMEKNEFVEFVDLKTNALCCLSWEKFYELKRERRVIRFPFKKELFDNAEVHKKYMDSRDVHKPYGMNFFEFLVSKNLKDDYCEFEIQYCREALVKWLIQNNLDFMLDE